MLQQIPVKDVMEARSYYMPSTNTHSDSSAEDESEDESTDNEPVTPDPENPNPEIQMEQRFWKWK